MQALQISYKSCLSVGKCMELLNIISSSEWAKTTTGEEAETFFPILDLCGLKGDWQTIWYMYSEGMILNWNFLETYSMVKIFR